VDADGTVPRVEQASSRRRRTADALALLILTVPLAVERALLIGRSAPTAADETLYLMQALDWLGKFIKLSPDVHRTWGVPAVIAPVAWATSNVSAYRVVFGALGVALCVVVYRIGRRFLDPIPAAFGALMLGLSSTALIGSIQLLPDTASALGVAAAFLFYWGRVVATPSGEPPRSLWPVGAAVGAVFYFNIAFAAFAAAAIGLDLLIFRRRNIASLPVFAGALALGLSVLPYFLTIWVRYGNPLHTIRIGLTGVGGTGPTGDPGYALYARWFLDSGRFFGPFWGIVLIAGVATLIYALARGTPVPRRDATALAIWLVVPTLATAFLFHAEERYMLPWFAPLFLSLGLLVQLSLGSVTGTRRALGVIALSAVLVAGAAQFGVAEYGPSARTTDRKVRDFGFMHRVAALLPGRGARPPCLVYARFPREVELHTGCSTARFNGRDEEKLLDEASGFRYATFYVWFTGLVGDEAYQPSFLEGYLQHRTMLVATVNSSSSLGTAYIYRFVPRE
jgi:hypothetical protein